MKSFGFMGYILRVDLTTQQYERIELSEELQKKFLGGTALAAHFISQTDFARIDPLGPENLLIFSTGPFVGSAISGSGRFAVCAKSPQTGIWGESDAGGNLGIQLKRAGYDALILRGQAAKPLTLVIEGETVSFLAAEQLWGLNTFETFDKLSLQLNKKAAIATIGQAGENLVPMASIITEGHEARAAGRCGLGAVMGAKKLKSLVVHGEQPLPVFDAQSVKQLNKELAAKAIKGGKRLHDTGTAGGVVGAAAMGDISSHNWRYGDCVEQAEQISGAKMAELYTQKRYYCPTCVIGCGKVVKIPCGDYAGEITGGPEYETLAGFGAHSSVFSLEKVLEANDLCNRYGLDTISVSNAINFCFEAAENGLLPEYQEYQLQWGNADTMISLIHETARAQGLGKLLGQGVRKMSELLGHGSEAYAIHVKGLEFAYHDPRAQVSLAVAYATNPRGACHRGCTHNAEKAPFPQLGYPEPLDRLTSVGKGEMSAVVQDFAELFNILKLCQFFMSTYNIEAITALLNAVTGWNYTRDELMQVGERSFNLKRLLNLSCGLTKDDDRLPARIVNEAFPTGGAANNLPDFALMMDEYYRFREWGADGIPAAQKIAALGLEAYMKG